MVGALVTWLAWIATDRAFEGVDFPPTARVGITAAPDDTRVLLGYYDPFTDRSTLRIVLGQAEGPGEAETRFRIELDGLNTREVRTCEERDDLLIVTVCGQGDGAVRVVSEENATTLALAGSFNPRGELFIDVQGLYLGTASEGQFRQFQQEVLPLEDEAVSDLKFPTRGVEVHPLLDIDPGDRRYDDFQPAAYRLYPDGWSFLVSAPGGPVDIRVTDIAAETRLHRMRDVFALFTGIFVGLAAEGLMHLVFEPPQKMARKRGDGATTSQEKPKRRLDQESTQDTRPPA